MRKTTPSNSEYLGDGTRSPLKDWLVFEVLGVFVGGFLSGVLAHRLKLTVEQGPRSTTPRRLAFAFVGGGLMGIGAKIALGCTSDRHSPAALCSTSAAGPLCGACLAAPMRWLTSSESSGSNMNAPFYKFGLFGDEASFIIAFLIGIGFGFFLNVPAFGSAAQARGAVLSPRPERSESDVHRDHHGHDRTLCVFPF